MYKVDLSDTPYEGSLPQYGHTGKKSSRERRGKYKANKVYKPSWRPNETLDLLLMTRAPRTARKAARHTPVLVVQPTTLSYTDRVARYGSVGQDYNED